GWIGKGSSTPHCQPGNESRVRPYQPRPRSAAEPAYRECPSSIPASRPIGHGAGTATCSLRDRPGSAPTFSAPGGSLLLLSASISERPRFTPGSGTDVARSQV